MSSKRRPLHIKIPQYLRYYRDELRGYSRHHGVTIPLDRNVIAYRIRKAISRGDYEQDELEFSLQHIAPTSRVLEVGGGVGYVSAMIQKRCPGAHVTSFEANADAAALYRRTMEANNLDCFELHAAILGNAGEAPTREFHITDEFWASSTYTSVQSARTVVVPVIDAVPFLRDRVFDILISDIEGGEAELVELFDRPYFKTIVMELHHDVIGAEKTTRLLRHLDDLGYKLANGSEGNLQSVCVFELR